MSIHLMALAVQRAGKKIYCLARAAQLALETPSNLSGEELLAGLLESIEDEAGLLMEDILDLAESAGEELPKDERAEARAAARASRYLEARP